MWPAICLPTGGQKKLFDGACSIYGVDAREKERICLTDGAFAAKFKKKSRPEFDGLCSRYANERKREGGKEVSVVRISPVSGSMTQMSKGERRARGRAIWTVGNFGEKMGIKGKFFLSL